MPHPVYIKRTFLLYKFCVAIFVVIGAAAGRSSPPARSSPPFAPSRLSRCLNLGATKAKGPDAARRVAAAANRHPHAARVVAPRPAADDAVRCTRVGINPSRAVGWRTLIAVVPVILTPFPHIALHLMQPPAI